MSYPTFEGTLHHPELDALRAENARLRAAMLDAILMLSEMGLSYAAKNEMAYGRLNEEYAALAQEERHD